MTINEIRLRDFLTRNKEQSEQIFVAYTELFNKIGKEFDDEPLQLALTGTFILGFLKTIECDKKQKEQLLKNIQDKL